MEAQRIIIARIAAGWRPITPQGRGGQLPIQEPVVDIPGTPADWDAKLPPPWDMGAMDLTCSSGLSLRDAGDPVDLPAALADSTLPCPAANLGAALLSDRGPWTAAESTLGHSGSVTPPAPLKRRRRAPPAAAPIIEDSALVLSSSEEEAVVPPPPSVRSQYTLLSNMLSGITHIAEIGSGSSTKSLSWSLGFTHVHN